MIKKQKSNIKVSLFINDFTLESAYSLGLIWADGSFITSNYHYDIRIECLSEDMKHFSKILNKTGQWTYYERIRKSSIGIDKKPITTARVSNKSLVDFLRKNDFFDKSIKSPDKILRKLKKETLIKAFLLGVIDGDGCFYFNEKYGLRQFTITGSINQDWNFMEKIFKNLDINYKIERKLNKKSGYSQIRVINKNNIKKLGDFIYCKDIKKLGLNRKNEKYLDIIK